MKCFTILLVLFACLSLHAQNNYDVDEKKADLLLNKVREQQASPEEKKELKDIAIVIQNRGQDMDERRFQYKKSMAAIDRAIVLFTALNDTLNIANNRKFKGYLLGRFEKFKEAKIEIEAAIALYNLAGMKAGVAVSQFDLARMFEFENRIDSALYYVRIARNFWQSQQVDLRILIINNMEVSLLLKQNQPEKAKTVQATSESLIKRPGMHWQAIIDFYYTSMLLYRTINDVGTAGSYQQLYLSKLAELRASGMMVKSYYENDR